MVEITKHLSDLNLKLQGKDQIITNMCDQVNAFKCKLVLWEKQLKNEDLMHFPTCNVYKSSLEIRILNKFCPGLKRAISPKQLSLGGRFTVCQSWYCCFVTDPKPIVCGDGQ
ncbi:hypothetical protein LAZ67_17001707 [Cordylochernes scorpioides]|uniref:Uncharacterized protein n=1 Tax=Cordylochernes scorpioides TaxID=51811 RepID=A0ABY6LDI1_9ARAC|nr:hypothetical protein LAZ67_17001707 [Cordylochernes scorpioides]